MGIDVRLLSPKAQKQILEKIAKQEAERLKKKTPELDAKPKTERKLKEVKVDGFLIDGTPVTFDSKREAARYADLALMVKTGQISKLQYQVKYELIPPQTRADGKKERGISYIADFVYEKDGQTVVEDSKGYRNPASATYKVFTMKRKLMLWLHGITVIEV